MLSSPQNSMTTRSMPTPAPPCGGTPYLHHDGEADRKSGYASVGRGAADSWPDCGRPSQPT